MLNLEKTKLVRLALRNVGFCPHNIWTNKYATMRTVKTYVTDKKKIKKLKLELEKLFGDQVPEVTVRKNKSLYWGTTQSLIIKLPFEKGEIRKVELNSLNNKISKINSSIEHHQKCIDKLEADKVAVESKINLLVGE